MATDSPCSRTPAMSTERITSYVVVSCIAASSAGLAFGYNIGVSGGVTSMDSFLMKFFPDVYTKKQHASESNYCKFNDQLLQTFTSSMYIAGLLSTFVASFTTKTLGRRPSMLISGILYIIGVILTGAGENIATLFLGRIIIGCGVGFGNQAAPIYLSEMAPVRLRGGLNIMFQLNVTVGILIANLVNYALQGFEWGWRLSLSLSLVPALLLTLGALTLFETPNSLIERGKLDKGKFVLQKVRGITDVDSEFEDLLYASKMANEVRHPFRSLLKLRNCPPLTISVLIQVFQQFTGINAIMFYSPVLFKTLGLGQSSSLYSAVITGAVNVISTIISIVCVDRFGRRALLLEGGVQMLIAQVVIGSVLGIGLKDTGSLSHSYAVVMVTMVCVYVAAFAWSWGAMGMLIPTEIFPLEVRSAGQSIAVCSQLLLTFLIAQAFLSMLCTLRYAVFFFFSAWIILMSLFVLFFVPETQNIPIDAMGGVWKRHWFWKIFVANGDTDEEPLSAPLLQEESATTTTTTTPA